MKIEKSEVTKLVITDVPRLDPITVITQDFGKGQGKINIDCYGKAWSSYWGAMGDQTITEFFCGCDEHYIAKNLDGRLDGTIFDCDAVNKAAEGIGRYEGRDDPWNDWDLMSALYGGEMSEWGDQVPKMTNPDYEYLCRIIKTVQEALTQNALADYAHG